MWNWPVILMLTTTWQVLNMQCMQSPETEIMQNCWNRSGKIREIIPGELIFGGFLVIWSLCVPQGKKVYEVILVFSFRNCSDVLWEKNVLGIEITRTIYSKGERSVHFLKEKGFLTCSWRFLRSNALEQLEFKSEKIIGI